VSTDDLVKQLLHAVFVRCTLADKEWANGRGASFNSH